MRDSSSSHSIVACARSWRGTGFAHQGRIKASGAHSGGVDCLGLLSGVARELGLSARDNSPLAEHDILAYSKSPDGALLQSRLAALLHPIEAAHMQPGDVALFALDGRPQHLAILSDYGDGELGMIHAYAPARRVVEHRLDAVWRKRLVCLYRCP